MNLEHAKSILDAVLYEGCILYPYRASAVKNQQRFNFGVLSPRDVCEKENGGQAWSMRTECLLEGSESALEIRVRFLHLVSREAFRLLRTESGENIDPVPAIEIDGVWHHTWHEAIEREVAARNLSVRRLLAEPHKVDFTFPSMETTESLSDAHGRPVGKLVRTQKSLHGSVTIRAETKGNGLNVISVEIENTTPVESTVSARDEAPLHSFVSTHTILAARNGRFVSLLDPPDEFAGAAAACENVGTWPVLVGPEGRRDMMLSSPIILYDYPQIAPESSVDFFDGTEIDEMLALRIMTLTEEEKREMRQLDDRARRILEQIESLPPEHWRKLHGAVRGMQPVSSK